MDTSVLVCLLDCAQSDITGAHHKRGGVREAGELLHCAGKPQVAEARTVRSVSECHTSLCLPTFTPKAAHVHAHFRAVTQPNQSQAHLVDWNED